MGKTPRKWQSHLQATGKADPALSSSIYSGAEHSAQKSPTLFKTFSMHLVSCECSVGAKKIIRLDRRN